MAGVTDAPIFDPSAFRLDGEHADLIARVRQLAAERFAPRAAQHDREASFPTENYRDLHAAMLAVCIPREHGGLGADYRT
jgi:alkylation response protein AidB-like acyl-CoA dehydrogenase